MTQPEDDNRSLLASQPLITEAKNKPIEHPAVEVPKMATPLPEDHSNWELTFWDRVAIGVDDTIKYTKTTVLVAPHIVTLMYGLTVKNWKTTIGALVAGLATVLNALGIVHIPAEVQTGIIAVALFIVGLFARDASNSDDKKD